MTASQLPHVLLDQSKDLFWMIDPDFRLIYANKSYLNLMKNMTGVDKELNESVLVEGFGEGYIEKWKAYYTRALTGDSFEIEEHFYNTQLNEIQYSQVTFEPLLSGDSKLFAVACQTKDITQIVKQRSDADQLMNASLDVFCTINEQGNFVYVSAAALNNWGYLPEELVGRAYIDFTVEEDLTKTQEAAAAILAGQDTKSFVNRYKHKNGGIAYNSWSVRWDATAKLLYCVARDNKDVIGQEAKILQSEERFKALVQEGSDMISIIDANGKYSYTSPTTTAILGITPEEFQGNTIFDFIHPDDIQRADSYMQQISTKSKVFVEPFRLRNGNSEWRWIETVLTNMLDNPAVNGIVANSRDITDKIEQEEKIQQSEQRFKALVQEGSDLIAILDAEGKYTYVSPTSTSILGMAPEDFIGRSPFEFIHPDDLERTLASLQKIATENKVTVEAFRFENSKKEWRWIETVLTNMLDNPAVKGIVANSRDITMERKLKELNRLSGSLAKIGSWEIDFVKENLFWSDEVHHLHETDPTSFVPTLETGINFYREDFQQSVKSDIENSISTGEPFDFEAVLITASRKEVWVRTIGETEFVDGKCLRMYGSFQDISSLKNTESRLRSLSENLPGVIYQYTIHPDGTDSMEYISGMVEQLWGYTTDQVMKDINLLWDQIKLGGDFEEVKASIHKSIQTKSRWTSRFKIVLPTGELKTHIGNGGLPIFSADGRIVFNVIILDITQEAKNEALLFQASEMAKIGSWELDLLNPGQNNMYWSPMVKQILQVDDHYNPTLSGGLAFYAGPNTQKVHEAVSNLIATGLEFDEEILLETAQRQERWIRVIGKSEIVNDKRTKIYGSFQDIHERKKAEIRLAESENMFRTILEAEPECIKLLGPGGELLMMNPAGLAMIEADNEAQVMGKSIIEILLPEHRAAFLELTKNVFKGKPGQLVFAIEGFKGTHRWLETHAVPMKNDKGVVVSLLGITRDITERKNAEESILRANERFEKVTEATNDAIWDWDLVNKTYYRSHAIERFFGEGTSKSFNEKEFWKDKFHPEDLSRVQDSVAEAIANPLTARWESEYRVFNEHDKMLFVIDRGVIIRNNDGQPVRMVGAMTDISEQKQMTQQLSELNMALQQHALELERSNEELEQFAFVASHDLQEPLRMISSFMDLLQRKYGSQLDPKAHQYIHFATDGAKRMKQIILDLLEYSRASRLTDAKEEVNLNEVLAEFKLLRRTLIAEKGSSIKSGDLPILFTYKAAITQVLHCLIDNALKYSRKGITPIVELGVLQTETAFQFSIKDNGIGIDPQFYNKIFIIFQRLHNMEDYAGTGIGLSIAKRHVEFLGGRIWLESVLGEGTVFYFTIPKAT